MAHQYHLHLQAVLLLHRRRHFQISTTSQHHLPRLQVEHQNQQAAAVIWVLSLSN